MSVLDSLQPGGGDRSDTPMSGFRLRPNPGWPKMWLRFSRFGADGAVGPPLECQPNRFEYSSSVDQADLLEFTVDDPDYELINSPILLEDLKTKVDFVFGYDNDDLLLISPPQTLIFFRQRPHFSENGVSTTISCYDAGVWLNQPLAPQRYDATTVTKQTGRKTTLVDLKAGQTLTASGRQMTINDLVEVAIQEVNTTYGLTGVDALRVNFDDKDGKRHEYPLGNWRLMRAESSTANWLSYLRAMAREETVDEYIEIFVDGNTLYFRPARHESEDQGYYRYHDGVQGMDLMEFEPEVNLRMGTYAGRGVDQISGKGLLVEASNTSPSRKHTALDPAVVAWTDIAEIPAGDLTIPRRVKYIAGYNHKGDPVKSPKDESAEVLTSVKEYTCVKGDATLEQVAGHYEHTNPLAIALANGLDPENYSGALYPGRKLKVPILVETGEVQSRLATSHAKQAFLSEERLMLQATATIVGDPQIKAGWTIYVDNVGNRFSGRWYVMQACHRIGSDGYRTEMQLVKNAIPVIGEGINTKADADGLRLRKIVPKAPATGANTVVATPPSKVVAADKQLQKVKDAAARGGLQ